MHDIKLEMGDNGKPIFVSGAFGDTGEWCAGVVESIYHIGGGERMVKYVGCNYQFKGVLEQGKLDSIYAAKRIISGFPRFLKNRWTMFFMAIIGFPGVVFLILIPKKIRQQILMSFWEYAINIGYMSMQRHILVATAYNNPSKELWRTAFKIIPQHIKNKKALDLLAMTIAVLCMIFQFDIAYRLRLQDVMGLIDKKEFALNPRKEMKRVLAIFIKRETGNEQKGTGRLLAFVVHILLFKKSMRNLVKDFMAELDLEKVKMDESDWYYALDRNGYDYGGLSYQERMKIMAEMDAKMQNKRLVVEYERTMDKEEVRFYNRKGDVSATIT